MKPRIGVTLGDVAGIGPEVVVKALLDRRIHACCQPVIYGPSGVVAFVSKMLKRPLREISERYPDPDEIEIRSIGKINHRDIGKGRMLKSTARLAFDSICRAVEDLKSGSIQALVTAPVHKQSMRRAGLEFMGHTELLLDLTKSKNAVMMMAGPRLKVALVTNHIPIRDVAGELSYQKIIKTLSTVHSFFSRYENKIPHIAVSSLNPHGFEDGGVEEKEIARAVRFFSKKKYRVQGPYSADTLFYRAYRGDFDVVVAMYHDQGLIPVKMLDFDETINVTLGLPFIRTSPDHGTAFDIAGQWIARAQSMIQAIQSAARYASKS